MRQLFLLSGLCLLLSCQSQSDIKLINAEGKTIEERFIPPEGFKRKNSKAGSFDNYLKTLPLKAHGEKVHEYDGDLKLPDDIYEAVLNIDVGTQDIQQCADAVMRLRAEYLFATKQFDQIHFNFTNGNTAYYEKYAEGYRFSPKTNAWVKTAKEDKSYKTFREYMDLVFNYAGSLSLSHELKSVEVKDIQPGDVFIKGGSPGHAVIVVDVAENYKTDEKLFIIAQSYMPAQDIHVLKNISEGKTSPWYSTNFGPYLKTPEWTFTRAQLMRFRD